MQNAFNPGWGLPVLAVVLYGFPPSLQENTEVYLHVGMSRKLEYREFCGCRLQFHPPAAGKL